MLVFEGNMFARCWLFELKIGKRTMVGLDVEVGFNPALYACSDPTVRTSRCIVLLIEYAELDPAYAT